MLGGMQSVRGQRGVSLIEILVVIVIISIVSAIALMQQGSANTQFQRQNIARELKVAFERARFDSVKRRAQPPVNVGDPDPRARVVVNSNSFVLWTDVNANGIPEAGEAVTTALPTGVVNAKYGSGSLPLTVTFTMRGETTSSSAPQFYVCNGSCSSPTNDNSNIVLVTPTGTVNLLAGGAGLPAFGVPSVNAIPTSSGINPDAVLP